MNHDEAAELLIAKSAGLSDSDAMLNFVAAITHSLCSLNDKFRAVMEEEGLGTPGPSKVVDYRVCDGTVTQALIECTDRSLKWVPFESKEKTFRGPARDML